MFTIYKTICWVFIIAAAVIHVTLGYEYAGYIYDECPLEQCPPLAYGVAFLVMLYSGLALITGYVIRACWKKYRQWSMK
ncbi:hypothetical protein MLA66_001098 [Salmonella enterica]|nr:hypothetical protein [Salmonella enterica]EEM7113008.1 hypothetical protein [Salmonella enterica subsp. enterica serovar Poona]EAS9892130.1 hypothetical protein [Salmonella enterica]EEG2846070.1 hypothetical protein [Salmonella enterica]EEH1294011.1 hypothetical protein [Salmonella enterica]